VAFVETNTSDQLEPLPRGARRSFDSDNAWNAKIA
jgi:hypothetical protein